MVSFVDALLSRYADVRHSECLSCELFIIGSLSPGKSGNNLILPPALSLNGCSIAEAGPERKIRELCRSVEELDLASNNLTSLEDVLTIVRCLPNLHFLNLSENDLSGAHCPNVHEGANSEANISSTSVSRDLFNSNAKQKDIGVRSLVLNNTRVPWSAVTYLLDTMPSLSELHLSLNNYTSMDLSGEVRDYPNVRRLYISGNPNLREWDEIAHLVTAFPQLEVLTMADCSVSTIPQDLAHVLPNVTSLNISNWPINQWEYLEQLNNLPHLVELRCQGISLLDNLSDTDGKRSHLIARLPSVRILNGSEISPDERIFAEKAFVRWHLVNDHVERPPRFYDLQSIYGRVGPLAEVNLAPPKCAQVTIVFNENGQDEELSGSPVGGSGGSSSDSDGSDGRCSRSGTQVRPMKVNLNKSVKEFKQQLSTIFGLPAAQMRLFYVDHVMIEIMGPEEMKFNQKKLYTYNVQDGDKFLLDPK